jgi:hypothetical protein
MAERRSNSRQKSFLQGRVFFNNRRHSADCLVRDVSARGAKLVFSSAVALPDAIELHVSNKEASQHAEVLWRRGKEIGVGFGNGSAAGDGVANAVTGKAASGDVAARMIKLEAEVALLKRKLAAMQVDVRKLHSEPE